MKLARKRNVSQGTINRAVTEDLEMKSNVIKHRNLLIARLRAIGFGKRPKLFNHLKNRGGDVRFFVDEKELNVDEVANHQMQSVYCL